MNDSTTDEKHIIRLRGKYAMAVRRGDPEKIAETKRNLATANLEKYISKVVADAPPLTEDQREHLAALLSGGAK